MGDTLSEICEIKRAHITAQKRLVSEQELFNRAQVTTPSRGFHLALKNAVQQGGVGLIAEIKKASPSKGVIRTSFDPAALATAYQEGGATCLSVLTDTPYFQGSDHDFTNVRATTALPMLRKDFMLDPYQILESRALGADCVLLILATLSDGQAEELESMALELGMDVLLETHDAAEIERALTLRSRLIGINNRNLKTLTVDVSTSKTLRALIPDTHTLVSESGISSHATITELRALGIDCFLVGESLMREADVAAATRRLLAAS